MTRRSRQQFAGLGLAVLLLCQILTLGSRAAAPDHVRVAPGNAAFQRTWERTDQPVASGSVARTWIWGPAANTDVVQEPYADSPGGQRDVQYFDKSRMEINSPGADPASPFYVTNGLLVVELTTGRMQVGDNQFVDRAPAQVNVAGDDNDPSGPTYATFAALRNAAPLGDGELITKRLTRQALVTDDPSLAGHGVTAAYHVQVPGIDHQVASPFWAFMNSSGPVIENGTLVTAPLFQNPFYATGYPISEAYWSNVKVAGAYRDVLMQCFERRCLTYTPGNPAGFETEAGNVGLHYHAWRYPSGASSDVILNEVMFRPDEGQPQWIELTNRSGSAVGIGGMLLSNAGSSASVALPDWSMPAQSYLLVSFSSGSDDDDLSDGSGVWYAGDRQSPFFSPAGDAAALYAAAGSILDFVTWSYGSDSPLGPAVDGAVAAGIWAAPNDVVAAGGLRTANPAIRHSMRYVVRAGDSIGRDQFSADSDGPADWNWHGGSDAFEPTPAAKNYGNPAEYMPPPPPATQAASLDAVTRQAPKRPWTIMVFGDGRDVNQHLANYVELNDMEEGAGANVYVVAQYLSPFTSVANQPPLPVPTAYRAVLSPTGDALLTPAVEQIVDFAHYNPGDPAVLADFITWASTHYPADHYALVLMNHADGWKGLNISSTYEDFLTMSELDSGMAALPGGFDVVVFELCLMAEIEVAWQIRDRARTMVASEEVMFTVPFWEPTIDVLNSNPGWDAARLAEEIANRHAFAVSSQIAALGGGPNLHERQFTISAIDLAVLGPLRDAVDDFANDLQRSIEIDAGELDYPIDNCQVRIKREGVLAAEMFQDGNFIDLWDLADKAEHAVACGDTGDHAQAVRDAVDNAVIVSHHDTAHPNAHGISIYFPLEEEHTISIRDRGLGREDAVAWAFDNPQFDPLACPTAAVPTRCTHLYKRDAEILIPALRAVNHPMADDPLFEFPNDSTWDEFLHRYYKPLAVACFDLDNGKADGDDDAAPDDGDCVKEYWLAAGTTSGTGVKRSACGSSDVDGVEGPSNDLPAHNPGVPPGQVDAMCATSDPGAKIHYYWDLLPGVDTRGPIPTYPDGTVFESCDEDCDRDGVDDADDDADSIGPLQDVACPAVGDFQYHLIVWDEHHDQPQVGFEDLTVNGGTHWQHFNVDDDFVTLHCFAVQTATIVGSPGTFVAPDDQVEYAVLLPANPGSQSPSPGTLAIDIPGALNVLGAVTCSIATCSYDPEADAVIWQGQLLPGGALSLQFTAVLDPTANPYPASVPVCADYFDGQTEGQVCTTTGIEVDAPDNANMDSVPETLTDPFGAITYITTLSASPRLAAEAEASIANALPAGVTQTGEIACDRGACDYDAGTRTVIWNGTLNPGEQVTLEFSVLLDETTIEDPPAGIENCATFFDGVDEGEVCVTTNLAFAEGSLLLSRRT